MSDRQSLAGAFAPVASGRGAALQGLLAPKRGRGTQAPEPQTPEKSVEAPVRAPIVAPPAAAPEVEQTPNVELASPEEGEQEAVAPEAAPARVHAPKAGTRQQPATKKAAASAVKTSETVPGALRNVGVYLPPALLADVKDAVYQGRTTYADLLIDAFDALEDERIASEFTPETTLTSSGMPRRAPRKRGEAGIQIQLRLDGLQVAWLDGKVAELGAPSRSALVSAVFKLYMQAGQTAGE
jgi:hypothetical protein